MTKFFKIIKILQDSLIRNCSPNHFQQPSKYLLPSDVNGNLSYKKHKHRKAVINKIQRPTWSLGSNLESSFLFKIPPTLTIIRRFSSRYLIPPQCITKTGQKKTFEIDRFAKIPTWMKKTKIKKFQENIVNAKDKNQSTSQTKNWHEFNVPGPKFKMTNLINKKSKTIQIMTESLKSKRFYKTVMNKIALPHFETKHLVLKKKTNEKVSLNSQSKLKDSMKKTINANYKIPISESNKTDHNRNSQAGESLTLKNTRNSPEPQVTIENNNKKSLTLVPGNEPMRPNKNDDRSGIRRYKTKNCIAVKDEKISKLKAKHFEKREVDMFIKKLAAKYGKMVVQKSAKPKRIYENNRPRIKYDLDTSKYLRNTGKASPMHKTIKMRKIETKIPHYSKKKLIEFIKKDVKNSSILKKENNIIDERTIPDKNEGKHSGQALRKEDLTADKKILIGNQFAKKKPNAAIKLNSKNGFLKDRDKHIVSAEKIRKEIKIEYSLNSENITCDGKDTGLTNVSSIKPFEDYSQNKKNIPKDQMIPYVPKNVNSLIVAKSDSNKIQEEIISNNENYESLTSANKTADCQKTDDVSKILQKNQSNKETKVTEADILSNKINESPLDIECRVEGNKNKQGRDHYPGTTEAQSSEPPNNEAKDKGHHIELKIDRDTKPNELMKCTTDLPNNNCVPKQGMASCKYKMSRRVNRNKPNMPREKTKHQINENQYGSKSNNEISLNQRSNNPINVSKVIKAIYVKKNPPSKEESIKNIDKKLLPMKIYKFHSHSESLDYKVYKYDYSPSTSLETNQSDTIKPNINDIQTGNLVQINNLRKRRYKCFESQKRPIDDNNVKLPNINTVRLRIPPVVNLKNAELITLKESTPIIAKQPTNHSVTSTKGGDLPLIINKVPSAKYLTLNLENQLKSNFEISRQLKQKEVRPLEDAGYERYSEGKGRAVCVKDNNITRQCVKTKLNNPEGCNLDYSHRELKKILPFLKNIPNEATNTSKKEDGNSKLMKKKEQTEEEKKLFVEKDINNTNACSLKIPHNDHLVPFISERKSKSELRNKHYNSNILCSVGKCKTNDVKASTKENPNFKVQKNEHLEDMKLANHIKQNSPSIKQLTEISLQDRMKDTKMWSNNIKENITFPIFDSQNKTGTNVFYYNNTTYKQKQELGMHHPTMFNGVRIKQHIAQPNQKSDKFHELLINEFILNEKMKRNIFLMHGFNRVSFLKVLKDIHQLTSEINSFPNHDHMIAINTNTNEVVLFKNKNNELRVLEHDFKTMLGQQLKLYNREVKNKYPEIIRQNENFKIYDLFDSTFILQCLNKDSLNRKSSNNLVEENLSQPNTSLNYFELINNTIETNCGKIVPMETETSEHVSNMIKQIKTDGRLIIKQNPKNISIIEMLDHRMPKKSIKSSVRESSTEEAASKKFNLINSKHMCFYSKYRMDCIGKNMIMEHNKPIANEKKEGKNTNNVSKTNNKKGSITSTNMNFLESIPRGSGQGLPILPINMKMSTFQEIYDYNLGKNVKIKDKTHKVNEYSELKNKDIRKVKTKRSVETESSFNVKQEDQITNLHTEACSESNTNHSFTMKENSNKAKIEPEVLHYMKKLDILCSNNGPTMLSNNTNILEKNTNQPYFKTETFQEKFIHINEIDKHYSNKTKNASDNNRDKVDKTGSRFMQEISYSTDIKLLEKNTTDLSDVINKSRKGTFEYLTKLVKKHKMGANNLSALSSSGIEEQIEESAEIASQNHKCLENDKHSSHRLPTLASPILKTTTDKNMQRNRPVMAETNFEKKKGLKASDSNNLINNNVNSKMLESTKNEIEISTTNLSVKDVSLNKNLANGYKSEMNSNKNGGLFPKLVENSGNRFNVMKNVKEQEKQLSQIKNLENNITADTNQITSSNKKLKHNNVQNNVGVPIKNQFSLLNTESTNKNSPQNIISNDDKNKTTLGSKIRPTISMNDIKTPDHSFKDICIMTEGLNKSKKTNCTNIQNYRNHNRARKHTHLYGDNSRIYSSLSKDAYKANTVSNKNNLKIQNGQNTQTLSNPLLKKNETKNFVETLNFQKGSRNKITEKGMIDELTKEEQKEVEVSKPIMEYNSSKNITDPNRNVDGKLVKVNNSTEKEQNDINTIINKKIILNNTNELDATESIPTGLRRIRKLKIESDADKGMKKYFFKKPLNDAESIKPKSRERKHFNSPSIPEIGISITKAKSTMTANCGTSLTLNQELLKHKKQLDTIINDKRVKSIKNKLSNNLKPRDESKIFSRKSHTLLNFKNTENCKKRNEDTKICETKERKEGINPQKNIINEILSTAKSTEKTGSSKDTIGMASETGNYCSCNHFLDNKNNAIKMLSEAKKPSFNIIYSGNDYKQDNEFNYDGFNKAENVGSNFIQQEANVRKEKNKGTNNICSTLPLQSNKKIIKTNKKNNYRENRIYMLKAQPKTEGFISQTLRSSNSQKKTSSKMSTATVKKRQASHLSKNRIKSELKQSAANLKKKISKHRLSKTDVRFKNDQKQDQSYLKFGQSHKKNSKKGLPIHVSKKEQKKLGKNYLLETPSRQVCTLIPPVRLPKEKPVRPKAKVTTKLMACTKQQDNVPKQNFKVEKKVKNYREAISSINKIGNIKLEKDSSFPELSQRGKGNTSTQNLNKYPFTKSELEGLKDEIEKRNSVCVKDLIIDTKHIDSQSKPAGSVAKIPDGNDVANCELIASSKDDIGLHSIVGNVVNNVKSKIQNFLSVDIAKSTLNKGIISKTDRQQLVENFKEKSTTKTPKLISTKKNVSEKLNLSTEQMLYNANNQIHSDKEKMKSENNNEEDYPERKTISELITFKPVRNNQTCPQMSYSEVLNRFYARGET